MTSIEPRVLLDGLAYVESPRWHDDRLWFPHWGTDEVLAVDLDGNADVVARRPSSGLGDGIAFLPDGRLLITGEKLMRQEPDGSLVEHCDLSQLTNHGWSEITVDGRGNIYVNSINFDFMAGEQPMGAPDSSRSSPRTESRARSPTSSRFRTGWSSRPTTAP
jgi:sugar lactone lactonase YvrE